MTDFSQPDEPARLPAERFAATNSRRRFLGGVGATVGLGALALAGRSSATAQTRASEFNVAGEALQPAVRVPPTTTTVPPTTTEPDTGTSTTLPPVPDGQIRFPIIVGEDDFCWISRNFGACRGAGCSRSHEGLDMMATHLLTVIAPVSGVLTKRYVDSGSTGGAGNGWTLYDESTDITYKFFHLDHHEEGLEVDDEVEAGQIIGYVGNTGTSGTNNGTNHHLHFEYRPGNLPADPFDLLERPDHVDFVA